MTSTVRPPNSAPRHLAPKPERIFTLRRIVISVLLAFALALFGYGFSSGRDAEKVIYTDAAIEHTEPAPGDLSLRQSRIGVDLQSGYSAELSIDGTPIPLDQVEVVRGLDQYWYTPGPGTATGALAPGRHCARATITATVGPDAGQTHPYNWCFSLH
jgi:hypothetical protein